MNFDLIGIIYRLVWSEIFTVLLLLTQVLSTSPCVSDCTGLAAGNYQSCTTCDGYVACGPGGTLYNMNCPVGLVWDDTSRLCVYTSTTCFESNLPATVSPLTTIQTDPSSTYLSHGIPTTTAAIADSSEVSGLVSSTINTYTSTMHTAETIPSSADPYTPIPTQDYTTENVIIESSETHIGYMTTFSNDGSSQRATQSDLDSTAEHTVIETTLDSSHLSSASTLDISAPHTVESSSVSVLSTHVTSHGDMEYSVVSGHSVQVTENQSTRYEEITSVTPSAGCHVIPIWYNIVIIERTSTSVVYKCQSGFQFDKNDNGRKFTDCIRGTWNPEFRQCIAMAATDLDPSFKKPKEAPLAEVFGYVGLVFVLTEFLLILIMDLSHCKTYCSTSRRNKKNRQ